MALQRRVEKLRASISKRVNAHLWNLGESSRRHALWGDVCRRIASGDAAHCIRQLVPERVPVDQAVIDGLLEELAGSALLAESLAQHRHVLAPSLQPVLSREHAAVNLFCYVVTRLLRPATVIETGCATGWTSALFLLALHQNAYGRLISIDLPPVAGARSMQWSLPEGVDVGFFVPAELRERWTLIVDDARTALMPLLQRMESVDLFWHDSDHSYVHMMWEYTAVWPYLSSDGVFVSDDIGWNTALWDFATAVGRRPVIHDSNTNIGAFSKACG